MLVNVLSVVLASAPTALVLLLGLGAAIWVFLRSRVAGVVLAVAVLLLGLGELISAGSAIFMGTPLFWGLDPGLAEMTAGGITLGVALVRGLGMVALLAAASIGPVPEREAA